MHASLLLGAVLLWRSLLQLAPMQSLAGLGAATLTAAQMSALGIRIAFAGQPLYAHIPLADQRLGGLLLWIPGMVIFVGVALRFLGRLGASLRQAGLLH
jgi:putative membrane protein